MPARTVVCADKCAGCTPPNADICVGGCASGYVAPDCTLAPPPTGTAPSANDSGGSSKAVLFGAVGAAGFSMICVLLILVYFCCIRKKEGPVSLALQMLQFSHDRTSAKLC